MSLESNMAARWAVDKLLADSALVTLLGGNDVYRDPIPDGVVLPAIAVGIQAVGLRDGPIRSGPNTHAETPLKLRTSIWDLNNYAKIEEIAARLDLILDGTVDQAVSGGGTVIVCTRADDMPRRDDSTDPPSVGWDIFWNVNARAA